MMRRVSDRKLCNRSSPNHAITYWPRLPVHWMEFGIMASTEHKDIVLNVRLVYIGILAIHYYCWTPDTTDKYKKNGLVNCETHRTMMKFWRLEMFLMIFCGLFSKLTRGLVFLRIWQHDLETVQPHYTFRSRIVYLTWESLIGIYTTYAIYIIWLMLRSVHIDSCALMNNVIGVWFGGLDINCHLYSALTPHLVDVVGRWWVSSLLLHMCEVNISLKAVGCCSFVWWWCCGLYMWWQPVTEYAYRNVLTYCYSYVRHISPGYRWCSH